MVFITSIVKVAALAGLLAPTVLATLPEALVVKRQDEDNAVGTNSYNCHDNCGMFASPSSLPFRRTVKPTPRDRY